MNTSNENKGDGIPSGNVNNLPAPSPPNNPEKNIPVKKDDDNDFTKPGNGSSELEKIDPTRTNDPNKNDHTRIDIPDQPGENNK